MPNPRQELAFAIVLLAACGMDQTTPTPIEPQHDGTGSILALPASLERARPLPLSSDNAGWCDLVVHRRDGGPSRHSPLRAPAPQGHAVPGQPRPLGRIQFARWEMGTRRAVAEASCVVELDGRSARELRLAFARELDRALGQGFGNGQSSLRAFEGIEATVWNGEDVDCMLIMLHTIVLEMDCGGVNCGPMATLRMAEEGPVADIFFECDNGCTVDMDDLLYDCGGVGGEVDEGTGNAGNSGTLTGGSAAWNYRHEYGEGEQGRCEGRPADGCVLESIPDTLMQRLRDVIAQMPEWARGPLLDILNDSIVERAHLWRDSLYDRVTHEFIEADTHGAREPGYIPTIGWYNPNATLHLHLSAWNTPADLKRIVCHEAVHLYWQLGEDAEATSAWAEKVSACIENRDQ